MYANKLHKTELSAPFEEQNKHKFHNWAGIAGNYTAAWTDN